MPTPLFRMAAMALAAAALFGADTALGQATKPTPPAAAGQPNPLAPTKLDLVGLQPEWIKQCNKDANGREQCVTTRAFGQSLEQGPVLEIAIFQAGEEHHVARIFLPLGLLIGPGFRLVPEKGEPIAGKFQICVGTGCFAEAELSGAALNALKKSSTATVLVRNQAGNEVAFNIPMKDFAAGYDGAPMDPKVLEQQNQELRHQLEEKARQQREQLEKQSGAQPTPTPSPTPTPPK